MEFSGKNLSKEEAKKELNEPLRILSANFGNFHPCSASTTYSLNDKELAKKIAKHIRNIDPDIIFLQEVWDYDHILVDPEKYEIIGKNDTIAIRKERYYSSFNFKQKIIRESFRSHSLRFKKDRKTPPYPSLKQLKDETFMQAYKEFLKRHPYTGSKDYFLGIPADFDVTSVVIEVTFSSSAFSSLLPLDSCSFRILLVNVHVLSGPWNDKERASQIKTWIINECLPYSKKYCGGNIIIGGDFNHDEERQKETFSSAVLYSFTKDYNLYDAAFFSPSGRDLQPTTSYPLRRFNYRYDHIFSSFPLQNYRVLKPLCSSDFDVFIKKHKFTWWMHLDHKPIYAEIPIREFFVK